MIESLVKLYDDNTRTARFADMQQLAREYQMRYDRRLSAGALPVAVRRFEVFEPGGVQRLLGVLEDRTREFPGVLRCYDYLRTKDLDTTVHTVIEVTRRDLSLPYFRIQPKRTFRKVRDLFVVQHPFFPDLEDFHARYEVHTEALPPERILSPPALELLGTRTGFTVEARDQYVVFYRRKKEMEIPDLAESLDFAEGVVNLLRLGEGGML